MRFDEEKTAKELVEDSKPHYTAVSIIAAAIAAAASVYGSGKAASAKRKGKRMSANADQLGRGGMDPSTPTADRFAGLNGASGGERGGGGARISDNVLGSGGSMPPNDKEQGFSLGLKSLSDSIPEGSQSFQSGAGVAEPQAAMPITEIKQEPPPQAESSGTGADAAGSYASIASSLLSAYQASQQGRMEPKPAATIGPMNLQPSALRYGQK